MKYNRKCQKATMILINILLISAASYHIASYFAVFQNRLINNPRWTSKKTVLEKGVQSALGYVLFPNTLTGNRLNLSSWRGYNEVHSDKYSDIVEIRFEFSLTSGAYLDFLYSISKDSLSRGIRLSRSEKTTNIHYVADKYGEFLEVEELPKERLSDRKSFNAVMKKEAGLRTFYIDGKKIYSSPSEVDYEYERIGFRGGFHPVFVEYVKVIGPEGEILLEEDFFNRKVFMKAFILVFLSFILINLVILSGTLLKEVSFKKGAVRHIIFNYSSALSCMVFFLFASGILADYPVSDGLIDHESFVEEKFPDYWAGECISVNKNLLSKLEDTGKYRVLLMGGSQTWGEGALYRDADMASYLEKELNSRVLSREFLVLNAAVRGYELSRIFDLYTYGFYLGSTDYIREYSPELLLLNVSNNDLNTEEFRSNLELLIDTARHDNVSILLSVEALSSSVRPQRYLVNNRAVVAEKSEKYGLPLADLNSFLYGKYESGFLWWDKVHLTSYGQYLAAAFLAENIIEHYFN